MTGMGFTLYWLLCAALFGLPEAEDVFVYTKSGLLRGLKRRVSDTEVDLYLGVPFAEAPIGDLRFRKPVPVKPWEGVKLATRLPPPCLQIELDIPMDWAKSRRNGSEDCLYLNLWVPPCSETDCNCPLKTVLVNVFGGGYSVGASDWDIYDGSIMAARGDVIFANMNYRVGVFGFLNGKVPDAPGNQGLHDTLLAVKWIKENVIRFGGDPDKITLFGESAGAVTVGYFLVSPLARGLVNRMILQSGSPYWRIGDNTKSGPQKLLDMARQVRCAEFSSILETDHVEIMSCMRNNVTGEAFLEAGRELYGKKHSSVFFPSYGDDFLPVDPVLLFENGTFTPADVLVGTNEDEGSVFLTTIFPEIFPQYGIGNISKDEAGLYLIFMFQYLMGRTTADVRDFYFQSLENPTTRAVLKKASDAIGDYAFTCPVNYFARAVSRRGNDVFYYYYTYRSACTRRSEWMGVAHFEEFPFIMGLPLRCDGDYPHEEAQFSMVMMDVWLTFAKTGRPPAVNGTQWPKFTESSPLHMELNPKKYRVGDGVHERNCRFWEKYIK